MNLNDLLIPFIKCKNSNISSQKIIENYIKASLGKINSKKFWYNLNLSDKYEDEYLSNFTLMDVLLDFLDIASKYFKEIICLSNDASEWSLKLRNNFGLTKYIKKWFISGDLKCEKPQPLIYKKLLSGMKSSTPKEFLFIDDKIENLLTAEGMGFNTILFGSINGSTQNNLISFDIRTFPKILKEI